MELDDLNLPVKIADTLNAGLGQIGVVLPLAVTQFFALALGIAALVYGILRLRKEGVNDLLGLLVVVGFGLFTLGIGYAWAADLLRPLPGELSGQVEATGGEHPIRYQDVRVALLDFHGDNIARESGVVDSGNGFFALTYDTTLGDRPRKLRVTAPGCAPLDVPLSPTRLRTGSGLGVQFRCVVAAP